MESKEHERQLKSLSPEKLQEILMQLLRVEGIKSIISNAISSTIQPKKSAPITCKKSTPVSIKNKLTCKYNLLNKTDVQLLEGEIYGAPFEKEIRLKPGMLFLSKLNVPYLNCNPCAFEPFNVTSRMLELVNQSTNQKHNSCLIYQYDFNAQLGWHSEDMNILKDNTPIHMLSLGSNRTMEFCTKSNRPGRCACHHEELQHNSLLTLPSEILKNYENRTVKAINRMEKQQKYTLVFMTIAQETSSMEDTSTTAVSEVVVMDQSQAVSTPKSPVIELNSETPSAPSPVPTEVTDKPIRINNAPSVDLEKPPQRKSYSASAPASMHYSFLNRNTKEEMKVLQKKHIPYIGYYNTPLSSFNVEDINKSTDYTHVFKNRSTAYYGNHQYSYNGATHNARPFKENAALEIITSKVHELFPEYPINSATVNYYKDGSCFIPHHSDNEPELVENSVIISVSIGHVRKMEFKKKSDGGTVDCIKLDNGDVVIMSQASQSCFTHSIIEESSLGYPRVNITYRLLTSNQRRTRDISLEEHGWIHPLRTSENQNVSESQVIQKDTGYSNGYGKSHAPQYYQNTDGHKRTTTLLLGDSMMYRLRFTDNVMNKCIRGAKINDVTNLINSADFNTCVKNLKVQYIYLCIGTNDIGSGRHLYTILHDYKILLHELKSKFPEAIINIFNIFPRKVIGGIAEFILRTNNAIYHMCKALNVNFIKLFYSFLNKGFLIQEFYHTDMLHFSESGNQIMKQCILDINNNKMQKNYTKF